MKRKVVQQGPSTLMVSLPSKWVKEYGIKKGDEMGIEEKGASLIINNEEKRYFGEKEIDLTDFDKTLIHHHIRALYRNGFDMITIRFNNPQTLYLRTGEELSVLSVIKEEVSRLVGMEVIDQKKDYCIIKKISDENSHDFDTFLRRIFILTKESIQGLIEGINENDISKLTLVKENHDLGTKFLSYLFRLLNKEGYKDYQKTLMLSSILNYLENILDIHESLSMRYAGKKMRVSNSGIHVLEDIAKYFSQFYELFYHPDKKKMLDFSRLRYTIGDQVLDKKKAFTRDDLVFLEALEIVAMITRNCMGIAIGLID